MEAILKKLEEQIAAKEKTDPEYGKTHRFCPATTLVTEAEIAAREEELDVPFPPSYRDALKKYGTFTLGELGKQADQMVLQIWPLEQHRTALEEYAEQLDCEPTAEAVADEIGVDEEFVAALRKVILVGVQGHEDFIGFDLRTRNRKSGECSFRLTLFDDTEIEALADEDDGPCEDRGFDEWIERQIKRRS